MPEIGNFA